MIVSVAALCCAHFFFFLVNGQFCEFISNSSVWDSFIFCIHLFSYRFFFSGCFAMSLTIYRLRACGIHAVFITISKLSKSTSSQSKCQIFQSVGYHSGNNIWNRSTSFKWYWSLCEIVSLFLSLSLSSPHSFAQSTVCVTKFPTLYAVHTHVANPLLM